MGRIIKNAVLTVLILTLGTSTAFLAYLHFFASGERGFSGEWVANLDVTEQAAVTALDWLQDIEAVSISLEDMEPYMRNLIIPVNLSMEQSGRLEGTFRCDIGPDSYDACRQAAYEGFATGFRALLGERLHMAGYEGDTSQEGVEALVAESLEMSTVSYLMTYGPALIPSLEELQERYEGSGTYEVREDILVRHYDAGGPSVIREEYYIRKGDSLILSGEVGEESVESFFDRYPILYTLKK